MEGKGMRHKGGEHRGCCTKQFLNIKPMTHRECLCAVLTIPNDIITTMLLFSLRIWRPREQVQNTGESGHRWGSKGMETERQMRLEILGKLYPLI